MNVGTKRRPIVFLPLSRSKQYYKIKQYYYPHYDVNLIFKQIKYHEYEYNYQKPDIIIKNSINIE